MAFADDDDRHQRRSESKILLAPRATGPHHGETHTAPVLESRPDDEFEIARPDGAHPGPEARRDRRPSRPGKRLRDRVGEPAPRRARRRARLRRSRSRRPDSRDPAPSRESRFGALP